MSACDRVLELAPQIANEQSSKVEAMWREYVVAWLECNGHPEDLTRNSRDIRALAETIVGKLQNPSISVEDTDLQIGAIIAGKENSCGDPIKPVVHRSADPVMSFNGQFVYETADLTLNGAGIEFAFARVYKNQVRYNGPLGFNWSHSYNHSLRVGHEAIFRSTGDLKVEAYLRHLELTPSEVQTPPMYSVTCVAVFCTHSMAANLTGWSSAMERAASLPSRDRRSMVSVSPRSSAPGTSTGMARPTSPS